MMDARSTNDLALLEAWRNGDRNAGDVLLRRHYRSVRLFFLKQTDHECEDLTQATFLACIEGIHRFRGEASFRTLLFAIAWRKLCRHGRARPRRPDPLGPAEPRARTTRTMGTKLAGQQQRARLLEVLLNAPDDTRIMLQLYYWEEMPLREIAVVFGRPINTIKTQLRRGRETLRGHLDGT